jgi:ABC-type tungstate transport system permease subunit
VTRSFARIAMRWINATTVEKSFAVAAVLSSVASFAEEGSAKNALSHVAGTCSLDMTALLDDICMQWRRKHGTNKPNTAVVSVCRLRVKTMRRCCSSDVC